MRRVIVYLRSRRKGGWPTLDMASPDTMAAMTRVKDVLTKRVEPAAPGRKLTEANANYAKARQALEARKRCGNTSRSSTAPLGKHDVRPYAPAYGRYHQGARSQCAAWQLQGTDRRADEPAGSRMTTCNLVASAEELAKAAGSITTQTLFDLARRGALLVASLVWGPALLWGACSGTRLAWPACSETWSAACSSSRRSAAAEHARIACGLTRNTVSHRPQSVYPAARGAFDCISRSRQ